MEERYSPNIQRRTLTIVIIAVLVIILPITLLLVRQSQDNRGRAQAPDNIEYEAGVTSGSVQKLSDSSASSGEYVLLGSNQGSTPTTGPTSPPTEIIGYGANTTGGAGGEEIVVKSASEFKAALEKSGRRIITMDVPYPTVWKMGKANVTDSDDNLTVICDPDLILRASYIALNGADNVIIDGCAMGTGDEAGVTAPDDWDTIALNGRSNPVNNVVLKNNTLIWGPDVTVAVIGAVNDVTLQDNIIAEGLRWSTHSEATTAFPNGHSYGLNVSEQLGLQQNRITITRNLLSRHMKGRTPQIVGGSNIEFTNNYIYGWGRYAGDGDPESLNFTNNYLEPSSASKTEFVWRLTRLNDGTHPDSVWIKGNILVGSPNDTVENPGHIVYRTSQAFAPTHSQMSATEARDYVLQNAGGTRNAWEERVVNDVKNGVATFYNGENHPAPNPNWP